LKNRRSSRCDVAHLRAFCILWCCAGLAGIVLFAAKPAQAQTNLGDPGIVARIPDPNQVLATYPDEASRFVALKIVDGVLEQRTTGRTPGAYEKGSSYMRAMQQISVKYDIDQPNTTAAKDFSDRVGKLLADETFRQRVLKKYHLTDLPAESRPPASAPRPMAQNRLDSSPDPEADRVLFPCGPIWLATLLVMCYLPRIVWNMTGRLGNSKPPSAGIRLDSGQLPESLREFKLFGQQYQAGLQSGKVVEEKTWSETYVNTVTSPATYQVVGDQVYRSGGATSTTSNTVTKDRIWVRTAGGGEAAWTFSGGKFVARQGQVISGIIRPLPNGSSEFLAAFNHSTGQSEGYRPSSAGQQKIGIMLPWLITTLVGAAGFLIGTALLFMPTASVMGVFSPTGLLTVLVVAVRGGFICLIGAAITARILIGFVKGKIEGERGSRFDSEFKPAYLRFLQESTPVIVQSLANV
jgi:hypothetical protein